LAHDGVEMRHRLLEGGEEPSGANPLPAFIKLAATTASRADTGSDWPAGQIKRWLQALGRPGPRHLAPSVNQTRLD
jgi:hypothetical protein